MLFDEMEFGYYTEAEHKARKALEHYEDGNMSQALDALETAIEINPSNSSWHFNKALTLDAVNRFEDAITEYETALQLNPNDLEILNSLGIDYTRTGQYDLAIDTFQRIEELDPAFEPCYCNRIITYTEMELYDSAEQMFYLAQQIDPDCALCYYNIGNSLFVRGEYKKAIRCWLRTAELEPAHPQINYRIAQAYWAEGDIEHGHEHFLAELRANPGDIDTILDFGLFLLAAGDTGSAKEKFNRILELKPDFAPALFYLGEIALDDRDYERAVQLYDRALEKDGGLPGPRYRLAQYALMRQQQAEAKDHLLAEFKVATEDPDILISIGSMFLKVEEPEYAVHCLLRAVSIDGTNADGYYYLGLASAIKGSFEDALEFFGHALDINPSNILALKGSAVAYLALNRTADAAQKISEARVLAGDDSQLRVLASKVRIARTKKQIGHLFSRLRPRPPAGPAPDFNNHFSRN